MDFTLQPHPKKRKLDLFSSHQTKKRNIEEPYKETYSTIAATTALLNLLERQQTLNLLFETPIPPGDTVIKSLFQLRKARTTDHLETADIHRILQLCIRDLQHQSCSVTNTSGKLAELYSDMFQLIDAVLEINCVANGEFFKRYWNPQLFSAVSNTIGTNISDSDSHFQCLSTRKAVELIQTCFQICLLPPDSIVESSICSYFDRQTTFIYRLGALLDYLEFYQHDLKRKPFCFAFSVQVLFRSFIVKREWQEFLLWSSFNELSALSEARYHPFNSCYQTVGLRLFQRLCQLIFNSTKESYNFVLRTVSGYFSRSNSIVDLSPTIHPLPKPISAADSLFISIIFDSSHDLSEKRGAANQSVSVETLLDDLFIHFFLPFTSQTGELDQDIETNSNGHQLAFSNPAQFLPLDVGLWISAICLSPSCPTRLSQFNLWKWMSKKLDDHTKSLYPLLLVVSSNDPFHPQLSVLKSLLKDSPISSNSFPGHQVRMEEEGMQKNEFPPEEEIFIDVFLKSFIDSELLLSHLGAASLTQLMQIQHFFRQLSVERVKQLFYRLPRIAESNSNLLKFFKLLSSRAESVQFDIFRMIFFSFENLFFAWLWREKRNACFSAYDRETLNQLPVSQLFLPIPVIPFFCDFVTRNCSVWDLFEMRLNYWVPESQKETSLSLSCFQSTMKNYLECSCSVPDLRSLILYLILLLLSDNLNTEPVNDRARCDEENTDRFVAVPKLLLEVYPSLQHWFPYFILSDCIESLLFMAEPQPSSSSKLSQFLSTEKVRSRLLRIIFSSKDHLQWSVVFSPRLSNFLFFPGQGEASLVSLMIFNGINEKPLSFEPAFLLSNPLFLFRTVWLIYHPLSGSDQKNLLRWLEGFLTAHCPVLLHQFKEESFVIDPKKLSQIPVLMMRMCSNLGVTLDKSLSLCCWAQWETHVICVDPTSREGGERVQFFQELLVSVFLPHKYEGQRNFLIYDLIQLSFREVFSKRSSVFIDFLMNVLTQTFESEQPGGSCICVQEPEIFLAGLLTPLSKLKWFGKDSLKTNHFLQHLQSFHFFSWLRLLFSNKLISKSVVGNFIEKLIGCIKKMINPELFSRIEHELSFFSFATE